MSIWREEKKIKRPLLYATGGVVLGETAALFLTADQGIFWLAAMLAVFFCAFWEEFRKEKEENGRLAPAFFIRILKRKRVLPWALAAAGVFLGFSRMEREESVRLLEERLAAGRGEERVSVRGRVTEIGETEYGFRLVLSRCMEGNGAGASTGTVPRRMYCYVDQGEGLKVGMELTAEGTIEAPEPERNPGGFDYRSYCRARGIGGILSADRVAETGAGYDRIREGIRRFRLLLEERLDLLAEETDSGILKAVLLGNRSDMDDGIYELYRKNGISHVLAISGLHVSIIGAGFWKLLRKAGLGFFTAGLLAAGFLFCYGTMTGFGPSVVRAVTMSCLSFLAAALGRTYDLPTAMCVPALGLLWSRPYLLTQASFQLSFLAVGAVAFPGGVLSERFRARGLFQSFLTSSSIQAVTAPAVLYHSFEFPVYGIFLNLLVIPLMTYVVVSGLLGLLASFFSMEAGTALLGGAHYILLLYRVLGEAAQRLPGASLVLGRPGAGSILLFSVGLLSGVFLARKASEPGEETGGRLRAALLLAAVWTGSFLVFVPLPSRGLSVVFLDVGQGDGIYLECGGRTMLADCGSSQEKKLGENCLVPFLKSRGVDTLDTVLVSHGDWDHISGIRYVLEQPGCGIRIKTLVMPEAGKEAEVYRELEALARSRGTRVIFQSRGGRLEGVLGEKASVSILSPPKGAVFGDRNEESLVALCQYGNFRLLLTGDVGTEGEEEMGRQGLLGPVTVLKAGHHGSGTSSGQEFLKKLLPEFAVISCGRENRYGHPSPEVVKRLLSLGTEIFDTRDCGAVLVSTDGKTMEISGYLGP